MTEAHEQRILILTPRGRDGQATAEVLTRAGFATNICATLSILVSEISKGAGAVCLAEEALSEGGYQALSACVSAQPPWSDIPFVILTSRHDEAVIRSWREKLTSALRNVSLLERPVQAVTLSSALRVAVRSRARQYEVREHIDVQSRTAQRLEEMVAERTVALESANRQLLEQISEREHIEEQLRHAQKMEAIGQLTGGIAHDFNNMLAIVVGSLNMLSRRLRNVEPSTAKYIDNALEGTRRAAQLTQRLLAFSRQQALSPKALDANKLVFGMSELLRGTLGRDIVLEAVTGGGVWEVFVDPGQLENVIVNVALNARDAMPDGGKLTIETQNAHLDERYAAAHLGTPAGQYVLISISDTGSGIGAEIMAKVFDPFFTTKGVGKGTGLGLSQVYGFVKQSGGHIKLYSEPGKGTSVKIYLPRHFKAEAFGEDQQLPSGPLSEGQQELILVVDDEEAVRGLAVDILAELGYRTLDAGDGRAALRLLDQNPDIVLMLTDIVMPELNGRMLADQAKKMRPALKVLYMTGFTRNAVVHNGIVDAGVNLIGKPFSIEDLADKVRLVLDGST